MARACLTTVEQFAQQAPKAIRVVIDLQDGSEPQVVDVSRKEFESGSFGYHATGKVPMQIGTNGERLQMNLLFTVIGSKPK
jgi:hypothetical protein